MSPRTKEQFEQLRKKSRDAILDAALELFAVRGFKATSIQDIADKAGVSKGLAYNYFENKEKILEAVLDNAMSIGIDIDNHFSKLNDPFDQIIDIIDYSFKLVIEHQKYWRILMSLIFNPEITDIATQKGNSFNEYIFKKIVKIFQDIGLLNAEEEARIFGALMDGIMLHYFFDQNDYPLNTMIEKLKLIYGREYLLKKIATQ